MNFIELMASAFICLTACIVSENLLAAIMHIYTIKKKDKQ